MDTRHPSPAFQPSTPSPKKVQRAPSPLICTLEVTFYTAQAIFAARDIQADQLFFVERSLLLFHRFGIPPPQFGEEIVGEWEKQLKNASSQIAGDDPALFGASALQNAVP